MLAELALRSKAHWGYSHEFIEALREWQHAVSVARDEGYVSFAIESDPNAEGFYLAMGARRIGTRVSPETGRSLPLLEFG